MSQAPERPGWCGSADLANGQQALRSVHNHVSELESRRSLTRTFGRTTA